MLAGMGGVSYADLAAAVSEAGGFETLGMAGHNPDFIRREMKRVRALTDKPFDVDLLAAAPESLAQAADSIVDGRDPLGLSAKEIVENTMAEAEGVLARLRKFA